MILALNVSCGSHSSDTEGANDSISIPLPDTLKVVTLYSPTSYFIYKEQEMGYDYDLIQRLASDKNITLQLEVAPSLTRAVEMLDSGVADVIAYEVPVTVNTATVCFRQVPKTLPTRYWCSLRPEEGAN